MAAGKNRYKKAKSADFFKKSAVTLISLLAAFAIIFVLNRLAERLTAPDEDPVKPAAAVEGEAQVHFIDVGQGDSELIVSDDGKTMLIDAGEQEYGDVVLSYLAGLGITKLDYVIATHPHSDHIGGLAKVIGSDIEIGEVIAPEIAQDFIPTTRTYEKLLTSIESKGCPLYAAENQSFEFGGGTITVISPEYDKDNLNNYSTVVIFEFAGVRFMFTGDIEKKIETQLADGGLLCDTDVLKVAHHGSSTSSSIAFLDAVTPEYCVIECGDSSYNHPNADTVDRLLMYTKNIYRTDVSGSIVFKASADGIEVITERSGGDSR